MSSNSKVFAIVLSAAVGVAGVAHAGSVSISQVSNGGVSDISGANLAGTVTNDVRIATDPGEQIFASADVVAAGRLKKST